MASGSANPPEEFLSCSMPTATSTGPAQDIEQPQPDGARMYHAIPALPETRDELQELARTLQADPERDLVLGPRATRESVLAANRSGQMAQRKVLAFATHEGQRMVLPDNSIATPGWTRVDLGLRYANTLGGTRLVWRAGVDNVGDQRAWKEAPYQFEIGRAHV